MMELYNDDCFNILPKIEDKTIDLFVLDLPYANKDFGKCTACKWDNTIDLDKMWVEIKRIMKPNAVILFYCNTKFGFSLIKSNPKWFRYDLIWKKSRKVGFLSANKQPLRQHENIYVFGGLNEDNQELKLYAKRVLDFIGKSKTKINKELGHRQAEHFFYWKPEVDQFLVPTEKVYNELIKLYKINEMEGFIEYKNLDSNSKYNPQKTKGKPYKSKERVEGEGVYIKDSYKRTATKDTTNRHPTSIIEHENIYVFKEKGGTYNPQKMEGKEYNKYRPTQNIITIDGAYGKILKENKEQKVNDRHPTSIIEHENVYVFSDDNNDDLDNSRNLELRKYAEKVKKYIGKNIKIIDKAIGNQGIHGLYNFKNTQFGIPTKETYNKLIELYKINDMKGFIDYETLKDKWENEPETTYNPQKTKGKPYKMKEGGDINNNIYGNFKRRGNNKGDRHPTSIYPDTIETTILEHNNPPKSLHRTQKPISLCEWLIKTYSNEGDLVMDFSMGSGTTGEACKNTNRKFIGVEMDEKIFEIAKKRLSP